jgi:biopolymer transport protein TolQ
MNGAGEIVNNVTVATTSVAHDFSMFTLFAQASMMVKIVIILLLGCSFWSWTIVFAKISIMKKLNAQADKFEKIFWNCISFDSLYDGMLVEKNDPFTSTFAVGMKEWRSAKAFVKTSIKAMSVKNRIENMMRVTVGREMDYLEKHIGFLATVGSTAPFVGLFGTVWGIMNSFESIGLDQNTNLTSVAPGIAEALFATALGLIVTIPAVIAYNKISSDINRYQNRLDAFVDEFSTIVSRQLDELSE